MSPTKRDDANPIPDDSGRELLSRSQVARLFGVSASTVTRWARRGLIRAVRTPGGHYRFHADEVRRAAALADPHDFTRLD